MAIRYPEPKDFRGVWEKRTGRTVKGDGAAGVAVGTGFCCCLYRLTTN